MDDTIPLQAEAYRENGCWRVRLIGPGWVIRDLAATMSDLTHPPILVMANFGGTNQTGDILLTTWGGGIIGSQSVRQYPKVISLGEEKQRG